MLKNNKLTYISLFSSAGIGCYGFKLEGFECIATSELLSKRLEIQRVNNKCKYKSGYICGDITKKEITQKIYDEINLWNKKHNIKDVDVVIATPPCQGMSVANQKKNNEMKRNSLVVEAIDLIKNIKPKIFIFENVQAFLKTLCTSKSGILHPIKDEINDQLASNYSIYADVINFKNYGSNSSRIRTLVIGVNKKYLNEITPFEIFPNFIKEKTLRQVIGNFKPLNQMGEFDSSNPLHSFKKYDVSMRPWVHNLKEGQSAFDNKDPKKRPHKVVNGRIVQHCGGFGDKYKRQIWDKVAPCIHTANDCLASQNTVHPVDDRVFSIAELMEMMTIPKSFKWFKCSKNISNKEMFDLICKNELNIRKCIGEAVPTNIFRIIAKNIKNILIDKNDFLNKALEFEQTRSNRYEDGCYFTNKVNLNYIFDLLPDFKKTEISILEPAAGSGCFLPIILKKYQKSHYKKIHIYLNELDAKTVKFLVGNKKLLNCHKKFTFDYVNEDYTKMDARDKYDLIIGNPPFSVDKQTNENLIVSFWRKALKESRNIIFISPKYLIFSPAYSDFRRMMEKQSITSIIDFGEIGFKDALIETICIKVDNSKKSKFITVKSIPKRIVVNQSKNYIFDSKLPYWIIYRNKDFDKTLKKMNLNIFGDLYKTYDFKNSLLSNKKNKNNVWMLRSKNIDFNKPTIKSNGQNYDKFVEKEYLLKTRYYDFVKSLPSKIYLIPNLSYYPRVLPLKTSDLINCKYAINGSILITTLKNKSIKLTMNDVKYYYTDEFRRFYSIACNYCTRTLNVDKNTIMFFGKRK